MSRFRKLKKSVSQKIAVFTNLSKNCVTIFHTSIFWAQFFTLQFFGHIFSLFQILYMFQQERLLLNHSRDTNVSFHTPLTAPYLVLAIRAMRRRETSAHWGHRPIRKRDAEKEQARQIRRIWNHNKIRIIESCVKEYHSIIARETNEVQSTSL